MAPHSLRSRILGLIEREIDFAKAGRDARIVLKLNAIVDPESIEAVSRASQASVDVDLIVRGICSVRPVPGLSERVRIRSVVGEFLEHSRIFGFANGGFQEWYIGSADLIERNLDRRIEAVSKSSRTSRHRPGSNGRRRSCWLTMNVPGGGAVAVGDDEELTGPRAPSIPSPRPTTGAQTARERPRHIGPDRHRLVGPRA